MTGRRAPCAFRQTDITRALKAARAAGFESVRVEIDRDGKIVTSAGDTGHAVGKLDKNAEERNDFEVSKKNGEI